MYGTQESWTRGKVQNSSSVVTHTAGQTGHQAARLTADTPKCVYFFNLIFCRKSCKLLQEVLFCFVFYFLCVDKIGWNTHTLISRASSSAALFKSMNVSKGDNVGASSFWDESQEKEVGEKAPLVSSSAPSTADFAHHLWLSYALSYSQRRQMPNRPVQLAGLSLEPVCQRGDVTASAAPGGLSLCRRMRGASTSLPKKRESQERRGKKSDHIKSCWEWQRHHFGDKNKPN